MRLGINGFFWNRENTGSGQYTRRLAYGLLNLDGGPECLLFRPHHGNGPASILPRPAHISERLLTSPLPLGDNLAKLWFEQVSFPRACKRWDADLIHVPYWASPLRAPAPNFKFLLDWSFRWKWMKTKSRQVEFGSKSIHFHRHFFFPCFVYA